MYCFKGRDDFIYLFIFIATPFFTNEGGRIFVSCETEKGLVLRDIQSENGSGKADVVNWHGGADGTAELLMCQWPVLELQGSRRDCGMFEIVQS